MPHTIVLYQPTKANNSRTFSDFENTSDAMNGLCQMFERKLKSKSPTSAELTYDVSDLFRFLDALEDLSLLVFNEQRKAYQPYGADWIKNKLYLHLKQQQQVA
eukprot:TRINITY_DN998_c13_g1_i1.p3 TRINITY_DN998_c13_g1~~TRINITY_DN998_c13_g1_i1.p3  ORF type:complete len:103 (+),score=27.17 TRINITY_DN998_c13_g1_i1:94-402(+)